MDSEKMRMLQSEFESRYNPLTYNAIHEPKKLSIEQRHFDFLDQQYVKDREWKDVKSFYNGSINLLERSVLGTLAMARDYNIATRREREPNYQPMTEGVAIIDEALKSEHLQPFNVKGDTVAEQFRLDLVQGAGQLATQVAATVFTGGAASTALIGAQIAGNQYLDLKEEGVDTKRAAQASIANAILQTPLERLSLGKLLKRVPAGSTLGKKLKQIGESALTEAFTEGIQQYPEEITNMIAKNEGKSIQELAAEFDKNVGTYTKNALYAGLIGGILGGGASTIRVALDRNVHKEQLNTLEERIDNVKKSGAESAYAASVINSNLQGSKISIDAEALYQYAQTQNIDEIASYLGVEANNIERAAQEGLDIDIMQGNFEVMAAQKPDFYSAVKDSIIFEDNGYSISKEKMQKELQKEYQRLDINDEEFRVWKDTRIQELLSAGATKQEALDTVALLSSRANIANPDDPMQYFRDKPVSFKRVVSTPNGRYMQTKSANEKLIEDERNFAGIVDEYTVGKINDTKTYNVMTTPLALGLAGGKILPVTIDGSKIKHIFDGHSDGMTPELLKQVPRAMADPMMVLDSYAGRKVVVLDLKDAQGSTIIVPLELDVERNRYQVNAVSSAYGKGGENGTDYDWFIEHNLKKGRVSYINKEKTAKWLQSPGSDSASRGNDLDSLINNSIPDENALRKRREEMQGYYQTAFHGSPHKFNKFNLENIGTGEGAQSHGWGLYFAKDRSVAGNRYRFIGKAADNSVTFGGRPIMELYDSLERQAGTISDNAEAQKYYDKMALIEDIEYKGSTVDINEENFSPAAVKWFKREIKPRLRIKGSLIEVDIPENNVLLDEQKTLAKQDENVKNLLKNFYKSLRSEQRSAVKEQLKQSVRKNETSEEYSEKINKTRKIDSTLSRLNKILKPLPDTAPKFIQRAKELSMSELKGEGYDIGRLKTDQQYYDSIVNSLQAEQKELQAAIAAEEQTIQEAYNKELETIEKSRGAGLFNSNAITGDNFYAALSEVLGGAKEASIALNKAGIKGITYYGDLDGRAFVVFDDKSIKILNKYNQKVNNDKKGSITWDEEGKAIISLFEGADMSTVIHEAVGHYFIENLMREGALPNATEQMKKDRQTMLDYAELTELEWNQLNKPFEELTEEQQKRKTAAHERWATAAEQYIMLGKSPSKEMQGPLSRFQKWLLETYKTIKDFISTNEYAVPITQEVQEVFDRMLASQEDINIMERVDGYFAKLPSVITDNLSDASKRRLQNVIVKAHDKAVNLLTKQSLENFTDQRKMQIEEYRAEILPAIRQELEQQPIYAAENMLLEDFPKYKTGKAVAEYYRKLLSRAMDIESKPLSEKEELDIVKFDMISEASGFTSGDELSSKLLSEPALQQAITLYADEMVQVKFPDIYKERRLAEQAAREAFYTDDSGLVIGVEQQIIEDAAAGILAQQRSAEQALALARARRQQAKLAAKTELSNMVVADAVRTSKYISAERRAAAKAIDAAKKNDYDSALKYKRLQALNHAMVQESLNMRAKIEQYKKYLKRQMKAKKDTWVDEKHFVQAAALMERMGLNHKEYNPEFRTQSLAEYAAAMQNEYDNVSIADWLLDENRTFISPMQTLTFDRFEDVINALKNIKAISKQEKYITWYGKALDYKEFKDQAIENLLKLKTKWQSGINSKENVKPQQRLLRSLTNTDNFFERMDGWKYGFFSKHFGESVQIAANKKALYTMEFEERIADATKKWLPDKKAVEAADKEIYYEALNANVSKHNLIKILLYLGTESSSYKLCSVREKSTYTEFFRGSDLWVEGDVELTRSNLLEFLGNVLTEADINYAQKVVDACNAHWDETSDMVKRMTGFSPERVDALPAELTLRNGAKVVFRGGYVPLVRYSDSGSHPAALDAVPATNDKRSVNSIRTLHTNTGGTKTRDKSVYPLDLRKGAEYSAVMDNIHDLCYRELTTSFRKIMNDPEMYSLLKEKLGIANFEAFEEFLKKTAQPYGSGGYSSISERDAGDCLSWIRQKTVNVAIMLNFKTAVQNLGNPLLYGNVVEGFGYKDVMAAYGNLFLNMQNGQGWKATRDLVYSKSPFMKERSIVPDISMRDIKDEGRKLNPVERIAVEFGTNVLVATDNISAIPIWAQAYQKKINAGASEQEAVLFAETVIRRTLGSSRITDVAPIQRGSALMKLFTTFQGFFNTQFNQWQREFGIFGREWSAGRKAEASKRIVAFAAAKYFMFCLLNLALALEPPFEEDDDGWVKYGKELLQYPMSLLGPVGQVANTLVSNMVGMRTYGYRMTAVQGAFEQLERTGAKLGKVIQGKAEPEEAVEPLANLGGLIAGVPAQFNKLFFNAYDIVVNDMEPQWGDIYRRRPKRERD